MAKLFVNFPKPFIYSTLIRGGQVALTVLLVAGLSLLCIVIGDQSYRWLEARIPNFPALLAHGLLTTGIGIGIGYLVHARIVRKWHGFKNASEV